MGGWGIHSPWELCGGRKEKDGKRGERRWNWEVKKKMGNRKEGERREMRGEKVKKECEEKWETETDKWKGGKSEKEERVKSKEEKEGREVC